jgi:hypothetical protein
MESGVASGDPANLAGGNMRDPSATEDWNDAKEILLHKRELEWHWAGKYIYFFKLQVDLKK